MNERLHEALGATSSGDQSALTKATDVISDSLHAAVIMLKVRFVFVTSLLSANIVTNGDCYRALKMREQ